MYVLYYFNIQPAFQPMINDKALYISITNCCSTRQLWAAVIHRSSSSSTSAEETDAKNRFEAKNEHQCQKVKNMKNKIQ